MAEFKSEQHGVTFTVPDRTTVRQQLAYFSGINDAFGEPSLIRHWKGALSLIGDWKCDLVPDPDALDLDEVDDRAITRLIIWVGQEIMGHMVGLESVPKNE